MSVSDCETFLPSVKHSIFMTVGYPHQYYVFKKSYFRVFHDLQNHGHFVKRETFPFKIPAGVRRQTSLYLKACKQLDR